MDSSNIWTRIKRKPGLYRYNPSGQYFARVRKSGKLYRQKLGTDDLAYAKRKLDDFRRDLDRTDHTKGATSFAAVLDKYEATLTGASSTLRDKKSTIETIKAMLGGCANQPLRNLAPSKIEAFLADRYGRFSASTYNSALALVKSALDLAVRDKIILENPVAHLKYRKRETPVRITPTFEQFQEIVGSVRAQPFNADAQDSGDFLEMMGLLGLGQAELAALRRSDVDLDAGRIFVKRRKTGVGFHIPIFPQARELLEKLTQGKRHDERVFKLDDARKALASACKRLGYAPFSSRSLRRMFITRAIERGVDVKVIAQWQGHKDGGKLILDTYSHVNPVHSNRMAALMTTLEPANVVPMAMSAS
jgi:Site-specific recombinase XerD